MSRLRTWMERLRGLAGLGTIGGAAGGIIGALWGLTAPLAGWMSDPLLESVVMIGALGLVSGAACALGFGGLLVALESERSLERLSLPRMALLGALVGAALPATFILATSGLANVIALPGTVAAIVGVGAGLGASLSAVLVGVAQRAHQDELAVVDDVIQLASAD